MALSPTPRLFFFNDTATTEIYTLSLHDALPIFLPGSIHVLRFQVHLAKLDDSCVLRSEEHTSELQSRSDLVCRLLLEKTSVRAPLAICPPLPGVNSTLCTTVPAGTSPNVNAFFFYGSAPPPVSTVSLPCNPSV